MERVGFVGVSDARSPTRALLERGGCDVVCRYVGETGSEFDDLEDLTEIPLIVLGTSIGRCRSTARRLGDVITGRHVVVHTVRGIEDETLETASRILYEETPTRRIGFVTGPIGLDDLEAGHPVAAQCASHFPEVHDLVDEAMLSARVRLFHSRDLWGAELAAIYGRIVALMSGIGDELDAGRSLQATLFARGLDEIARFVDSRDGNRQAAYGLSGAGNLYLDTDRSGDIDFQMGRFLAEDRTRGTDELVETFGTPAGEMLDIVRTFRAAGRETDLSLPLLETVESLIDDRVDPADILEHLLDLPGTED